MDALVPGDRIGDAEIVELRFTGGLAEVYAARLGDRRVAVKRLRPEVIAVPSAGERLRLEAAALSVLAHPNIVEVIACGEHRGWPFMILEWLDGGTLADLLATRGALSLSATLSIIEQLADALATAHARGIIHRDIKAENVIVVDAARPTVKLVDFGIAKLLRGGPDGGLTTTMQVLGTPVAMAPEQILGDTVTERTDVYALGVLTCHLLTGCLPFLGKTSVETQELHLTGEPPRPSQLVAAPAAVDAVIRRALAKAPSARHPSVASFLADLTDALTSANTPRRGAALYIHVETDSDDDDDLDALDDALLEAAQAARDAGLEVLVEAGNAVLAAAALPGDGRYLRFRAIEAALAICRPRMRARVRANVADSVDALDLATLPQTLGAVATRAALDGITGVAIEPIDDLHVRVTRTI